MSRDDTHAAGGVRLLTDRYGPMAEVEAAGGDERVRAEVKLQRGGVAKPEFVVVPLATDVN